MKRILMGLVLALALRGQSSAGEIERAALQVAEIAIAVGFEAGATCQRIAAMADTEDQAAVDRGACRDATLAAIMDDLRKGVAGIAEEAQ